MFLPGLVSSLCRGVCGGVSVGMGWFVANYESPLDLPNGLTSWTVLANAIIVSVPIACGSVDKLITRITNGLLCDISTKVLPITIPALQFTVAGGF